MYGLISSNLVKTDALRHENEYVAIVSRASNNREMRKLTLHGFRCVLHIENYSCQNGILVM